MEKRVGVSISLKKRVPGGIQSKSKDPSAKYPRKRFYEKRRKPYLLPCGNDNEYCFLQVKRKNTTFCKTWKKIIWAKCRHHIETAKHKWEER